MPAAPGGFQGPAPSPYFQEVLHELRRTRLATELIAEALGHLIPYLVHEVSTEKAETDQDSAS